MGKKIYRKILEVRFVEDEKKGWSILDLMRFPITLIAGANDLPEWKHEAKEDFSPVGPIVREIIWLK